MTLTGRAIQHVMLGVSDLPRSVSFYRDKLGLTLKFQIPGLAFIDGGSVILALSEPLGRASDGPLAGAVEIVFGVPDVQAAYAELLGQGVTFIRTPRQVTDREWAATLQDPDGHLLSLFGPGGNEEPPKT
jgi:catechol 2,3-dioxygenase-like lactoylglutathione lyase family enzyme